jgi:hypothetical protein
VRFLEKLVEYLFAGGTLNAIPEYVATHFTWHRLAAIQIWIFVLFLIYTSFEELNARLGDGELMKIPDTEKKAQGPNHGANDQYTAPPSICGSEQRRSKERLGQGRLL